MPASQPDAATLNAPPAVFFDSFDNDDRAAARTFYAKYLTVGGLPIAAAAAIDDAALYRTRYLVTHLLAGRPDVLAAMVHNHTRLIIIGKDQVYTDMPEYRHSENPRYQNERVRGTGGFDITSFGEENLLNLPIDRYDDESIAVHEFCHTIDSALATIDPGWRKRLRQTFHTAVAEKGRWHLAYAGSNAAEYWAETCQCYFDCNRLNNWNHVNVNTREQLKEYDPDGYELIRTTFNLSAENDWRYTPVRVEPCVIPPPAKFHVNSYYAKFTYARELPVVASANVSDAAMLRANDTVRKLFAYRHDVLKAIINDGGKLIVLGRGEKLSDLPEFRSTATTQPGWDDARYADYSPATRVAVVPEENLLGLEDDTLGGASSVLRVMSRAAYTVTARRPIDPEWDHRMPWIWQQYELRLQRLDERLGDTLDKLFASAATHKLWLGTPAANDVMTYWSNGVEAYFDAAGPGHAPRDAASPIVTRQALQSYDLGLYDLIDQTFAYRERPEWKFSSAATLSR